MTTKALWAVAAVTLLSACSTQTPRETAAPRAASKASLALRMEYRQDEETANAVPWTQETRLWMGLIRGDIFGNPSVTVYEQTGNLQQLTLDLAALAAVADQYAQPLTSTALARGFRLDPAQARIGRVGSFTYDAVSGDAIGATGFIAPADDKPLLLIYTDRPSRLYGFIPLPNSESANLDVQLPAAGFHWLKIVQDNPKVSHLVRMPDLTAVTHRTQIRSP